ncbi:MAG: complex I NDUFA9 subunit family protein [Candidatus Scalinduaceae bacterium]
MILVTGGTAFVGRNIVRLLVEKGQMVRCLVRETSPRHVLNGLDVEYCTGNILAPNTLEEAFKDIDTVIHLVGIIKEVGDATFERVHAEGTKNVLEAAKKVEVRKYVHMSALGTRPNGISRYHKTKWQAEEAVRNSGLRYVILRPSIICGADDVFVNMFAKMIKQTFITRIIPVIGAGKSRMQPIYAGDVAHCFVEAAINDDISNKTYEIGGPDAITFNEILDTILKVLQRRRIKIHLPVFMFKPLAFLMEKTMTNPPLNRDQLIMLREDNVCDIREMKKEFNMQPMQFEVVIKTYLT